MTYSITARREKARFRCSDLDLEGAEFWKRKLERDGWTAIIIREVSKPQKEPQNAQDESEIMAGIDEHKQNRDATDTRFPWFLATCGFIASALVFYIMYLASSVFPMFVSVAQKVGWLIFAFGLVVVTVKFAKGFGK